MNKFKKSLKVEIGDMKDISVYKNKGRDAIKQRMMNILKGQNAYILENDSFTREEKIDQVQVVINLMKIIDEYDEIIPVLDKYERGKTREV